MTELHPFGPSSHAPLEDPREMPECYPIKGNDDSMLYHRPDSMNYGATVAEVWFTSPSAAEAAGFTLSNTHPKNASSADFEPGGSEHPCSAAQVAGIVGSGAAPSTDGAGAAADAAEAAASGAADAAGEAASGGLGKAAAIGGAGVAGIAAAGAAGLGGAKDAAASAAGGLGDAVGGAKDAAAGAAGGLGDAVGGAKDAAASAGGGLGDAVGGAKDAAASAGGGLGDAVGGAKDAAASAAGSADLGGAKDAAAGVAAGATGAAAGVAASASGASDGVEVTSSSASASASADQDGDHPYGPGSHAPFANVHDMPDCHPIKGNADSMKYHRPDSSGYAETKAEVWFVSPSAAEAAGFVLSGSHPKDSSSADFEPGGSGHPCTADQLRGMGLGGLLIGGAAAGAVAATRISSDTEIETTETVVEEVEVVEEIEIVEPETERVVYRAADTPVEDVEVETQGISGKTAAAAAGGAAVVGGLAAAASRDKDIEVTKPKVEKPKVTKPKVEKPKVETTRVSKASETTKATTTRASSSAKETSRMSADRGAAAGGGRIGGDVPTARGGFGWGWLKWLLPLLLLLGLILFLLWACGGDDDVTPIANPAPVATATAVPPTATAVPPTATAVPDPTATPVPDPTATPVPEPTATPVPAPAAVVACADLIGTLGDNGFTVLTAAAGLSDLGDVLGGEDPITIFAPTDAAFEAVPAEQTDAVLSDSNILTALLAYHVVPGAVMAGDLSTSGVTTLNGANLAVRLDLDGPRVNSAAVTSTDIASGDCVIHGIDSILAPPVFLTTLGVTSLNGVVSGTTITFEPGTANLTAADSGTLAAICNLVGNESSARSLPPIDWESTGNEALDAERAAAIEAALADCGVPVFNYNAILGDYEVVEEPAPAPEFTG